MRLSYLAATLILIVFSAVVVSGVFVPIYADEVSTKMTQATVFANSGRMLTAIPQCIPDLTMPIPVSWYPAAAIYQLLYNGLSPLMIRVSGVVMALLYVSTTALGLKRVLSGQLPCRQILAGFAAVLGLGVVPLTLVLSRSEQWLLLLLTYFVFFSLYYRTRVLSGGASVLQALIFITCTSIFYYSHPKAVFFSPVVVLSGWVAFRGNGILRLAVVAFTVFCSAQSVMAAKELFSCENAPILSASLASHTVKVSSLLSQPATLLNLFYIYLTTFPAKAIQYATFRSQYFSLWLPGLAPGEELGRLAVYANWFISGVIYSLIVLGFILPLIATGRALLRRESSSFHLLLIALWTSLVAHLACYVNWNFYASVLAVGVLCLLVGLSLLDIPRTKYLDFSGRLLLLFICFGFLLSAFVHFTVLVPQLIDALGGSSELGISGQPNSVPTFRYQEQRDKIRKFSTSCGLKGDDSHRLAVDDLTYFAFDRLREPMHLAYISEKGSGQDIKGSDFPEFLKKMGSPGVIGRCSLFPDVVRQDASSQDGFCCIRYLPR